MGQKRQQLIVAHWDICPKFLSNWLNQFKEHLEKVAILTQGYSKYLFFSAKTNEGKIGQYFENSEKNC